jgi:hypothetical protein
MRAFIRFEFEVDAVDREHAENMLDEYIGELRSDEGDQIREETLKWDLVIVGEHDKPNIVELTEEIHVVHPWDQGLWIFPDDHPLAQYERMAKDRGQSAKQEFLEMGRRMLPQSTGE